MSSDLMLSRRGFVRGAAALMLLRPFAGLAQGAGNMSACVYADETLAQYGFPEGHPFGIDRQDAFLRTADSLGLLDRAEIRQGRSATRQMIERFHHSAYVEQVISAESAGVAYLDQGDTPVFPGVYETSSHVVGSALAGLEAVMEGHCKRTLQAIGGLHHAGRGHAAGFCVFNDLGAVIETLRSHYGIGRVAYVDIDVHFGDGVFYGFEDDPQVIIADVHQDPSTLYPGTGFEHETGKGKAKGTKLNLPLRSGSGDAEFSEAWQRAERHLERFEPEFFVFQCGADGLGGDPLAGLNYTSATHAHAARRLRVLADRYASGRLMAFGGGGYNRPNLGKAWSAVLKEFLD